MGAGGIEPPWRPGKNRVQGQRLLVPAVFQAQALEVATAEENQEALAQLANDLQTRPETRARVEAMKEQLLDNQSVSLWLDTLWQKTREGAPG